MRTGLREHDLAIVPGLSVGHWTHAQAGTGCTVVVCARDAVAGVDVRGGAPGTRELCVLDPANGAPRVQAIVLAGGSACGLAAADGVVGELRALGRGFATDRGAIPIVPAAVLYDCGVGEAGAAPSAADGARAFRAASGAGFARGSVGAGTGATVGKVLGRARAMRGGLGSAGLELEDGLAIGALAAVNAFGDVRDARTAAIAAGARDELDRPADTARVFGRELARAAGFGQNTTLAIVATNATFDAAQATRLARMAQAGLARAVAPCHTPYDGDVVFALATGECAADLTRVGVLAAEVLAAAILDAVLRADDGYGLPAARALDWLARENGS